MIKKLAFILFAVLLITQNSPAQTKTVKKSPASAQQTAKGKNEALETIGATSALLLYNTYICIGSVSDGYETLYKKENAISLLSEQVNGMSVVIDNYTKLLGSGFLDSDNDRLFVNKIITGAGHLKTEASSMKAYIDSKSNVDLDSYNTSRDGAWSVISDLLGLKK